MVWLHVRDVTGLPRKASRCGSRRHHPERDLGARLHLARQGQRRSRRNKRVPAVRFPAALVLSLWPLDSGSAALYFFPSTCTHSFFLHQAVDLWCRTASGTMSLIVRSDPSVAAGAQNSHHTSRARSRFRRLCSTACV